jgi:hypothetical protein
MSINDGGMAFAVPAVFNEGLGVHSQEYGMTLRDYFAAKALQGMLAHHESLTVNQVDVCYDIADAMIKAREVKS